MENRFNNQVKEEETIDLLELVEVLWRKLPILIATLVAGAVIAFCTTVFFITPQYESTAMIYILSKTTSITSLADLQIGSQLTVDFQIIASTREVLEASAKDAGVNIPYERLKDKVTISNPTNSRVLEITVRDADPARATNLANSIANQLRTRIADVMDTDKPSIVQTAIMPLHPVSPSILKNTLLGGFGAFVLVAAVFVVIYLLDDTIKDEDDVEKYLHQNVIALVPLVENGKNTKHKKAKQTSSNKVAAK